MRRAIVITAALLIIALMLGGVAAQSPFEIRVFIDNENLTVYIPSSGLVSLRGFGFQVQVSGQTRLYVLEDYASFGIPFDQLPTPLCFRLRNIGTRIPLAQACNGVTTLTQELAPADVFWFDAAAGVSRAMLLVQGDVPFGICASGANECSTTYSPATYTPTITPSPTSTLTPTSTPTLAPTPTPTLTPFPMFEGSNADWIPQITIINGLIVALVPPGCFLMGSVGGTSDEQPINRQCVNYTYYIGVTEVTNAQYALCVDDGLCRPPSDQGYYGDAAYADYPVIFVDWFHGHDFCAWWGGALPTEREWEYAARGVESWEYPWGNVWDASRVNGNFDADPFRVISPAGAFVSGASWIGALDMSGNAWEWVSSIYQNYPYNPDDGREADTGNSMIVLRGGRGGSWNYLNPSYFRAANRNGINPGNSINTSGFRCARSAYP